MTVVYKLDALNIYSCLKRKEGRRKEGKKESRKDLPLRN